MQVNVINENNVEVSIDPPQTIVVEVDQGKAGRGITNITYQQEGEYYYLVVTYTDGTTEQLGPLIITGAAVSLLGGTAGAIAYQSAPDNTTFLTLGTPNQVLVAGTTAPEYKTLAAGNGIQITSSSTSLTISAPETGTVTSVNASGGTTGMGFSGGPITSSGTLTLNGTLNVANGGTGATNAADARTNLNAASQSTTISAGTGLTGGGDLSANRTIALANTAVTAGAYGSASDTLSATVNAQGQLTAISATPIAITNSQVSGLGTMSTQNANSVSITGGSITGITDLAVADGGTGASTAADARTNLGAAASAITISAGTGLTGGGDLTANRTLSIASTGVTVGSYGSASNTLTATVNAQGQLTAISASPIAITNTQVSGLGTMSTQNSNAVTITGGSITGITDLAIADGGTGASTASGARSNLGLGTAAVLDAGVANGVATLDAGGTVPLSQIPASIQGGVNYQGSWNASTNTPTITSGVGSKGYYYVVSVAGNTTIDGISDWLPGDWIIFNGTVWQKIDNTDVVASVNGYTGVVVLNAADVGAAPTTLTISAGTGLSGGGDLSTNRTISIANTTVSAGSYGSASDVATFTVNGQGQLTAAATTAIAISNTQVSGLGTMSTQNANSVAITGGSITGITDLAVADGGTGASTAAGARTNLGAAASGANSDITSLSGLTTPLSIAQGGTGATSAGTALSNLGGIGSITSADGSIIVIPSGTSVDLAVSNASPASTIVTPVRNTTGSTLTKGTVVYISGATGQIATVSKALATSDATSAQTLGMITDDLSNNTNGYCTVFGLITEIDTSAYTDGAQLYLSGTTAGAVTSTKPSAPTHLVYVAVVEYAHAIHGKLLVKVQNGYELDEIHDVAISSPVTGQTITYNSGTSLWSNSTVSLTAGVNGTLPVANGGTGQTTANAALNALLPSQTGNNGKVLTTNGTDTSWTSAASGTVTSVDASGGTTGMSFTGGPITSSGTLTLSGTLAVANGGTGVTTSTGTGSVVLSTSPTLVTPALGTPTSGDFSTGTFTWPTFNQNTTGTAANITATSNSTLTTLSSLSLPGSQVTGNISGNAANVTGVVAIANGGTGQTTANAAFNALAPSQTGNSGKYLTTDGTNTSWAANPLGTVTSVDVSGGTTGLTTSGGPITSSGTITLAGTLNVANGGTGLTTLTAGYIPFGAGTSAFGSSASLFWDNTNARLGIGTAAPATNLVVAGAGSTQNDLTYQVQSFNSTAAYNASPAAGWLGRVLYTSGGAAMNAGGIQVVKENTTDADTAAYMSFHTRASGGTVAEKMRLTSSGNLGIGTSSPGAKLDVVGTASISGNVTLSAGTANGVAYLNGSKVLTTGSALTFDGTYLTLGSSQYLRVQTTTSRANITTDVDLTAQNGLGILATSTTYGQGYQYIRFLNSAAAYAGSISQTASTGIGLYSGSDLIFGASSAEQMRLTSTGLGIGTSSPGAKLDVLGSSSDQIRVRTAATEYYRFGRNSSTGYMDFYGSQTGYQGYTFGGIDGTWMTISSSGNFGLGVTPSAWGSTYRAAQVGLSSSLVGITNDVQTHLTTNARFDGTNWLYIATSPAARYMQDNNVHKWFNAASGTAGTAISFTQAMTLDASGNQLLGTTGNLNYSARLRVLTQANQYSAEFYGTGSNNTSKVMLANDAGVAGIGSVSSSLVFVTGGDVERARIDSSGNLLVGTTYNPNSYRMIVNGDLGLLTTNDSAGTTTLRLGSSTSMPQGIANIAGIKTAAGTGVMTFSTGNGGVVSEVARIDSSGNLGIGLTPVANNGILQLNSYASVQAMMEKATVSATAATGTINFDAATQAVLYYTTNSSGNWTINIRGSSGLTLNNMMQTGQSLTLAFMATNGSTAYYQSALTIDGTSVTPKWQGGTAPTSGNASAIDAYVLTVIKTGSATFTVLASQTKFA